MKKYGLGIIGFGGMAMHHANTVRKLLVDRVEICGVYDINEKQMDLVKAEGLNSYTSQEEVLADDRVDVVLIATSNEVHKDIAIAAMQAGKHVICEKPVTMNAQELEEIIEVRNATGKFFTINQNRRVDKDYLTVLNCLETGAIGKPYVIESKVEGCRGIPLGWRCIKRLGGGMMLDWGVHMIDQIVQMESSKATSVYCNMISKFYDEVDEQFKLTITFASGLIANIEVGTNNYIQHPRWYILGEKGTLQVDDWEITGNMVVKQSEDEFEEQIVYSKAGPTKTMAPRSEKTMKTLPLEIPEGATDNFFDNVAYTYTCFLDAIEGKIQQKITAEQVLDTMKIIDAAFESAKTGMAITL